MKIIIALVSIQLGFLCVFGLTCNGPNEALTSPTPACPLTCQSRNSMRCMAIEDVASCQCTNGTIKDTASGKCVPQSQCPKSKHKRQANGCGINEKYSTFSPVCYYTCAHPTGPLCKALRYPPACVCISGTVRDTVNNAMTSPTPACPYTCQNLHQIHCFALEEVASCQCITGTIRDTTSGKCVPQSQCPNPIMSPQCPANQTYVQSMSACPPTCANPRGPLCQAIIRKAGCVCKSGTVRDKVNNLCVKPADCPKQ
ncbi:unnamed protein product [Oppiella nova]|uniref:TIL domain-containing protein n=1 Tax=Oppiella nova TaxID=334625 RepID=A0A7R9M8Y9_9ACAR|nr:unnamed protein product [Oppiella nova]CAG2172876.1 unnamed protein product [Oppiella nova]